MGGAVPLGYRVENRALHVVESEAEFVRALYRRYLELGSVVRLKTALDTENVCCPSRTSKSGRATGGVLISRGHLYWILSNPIYIGRLRHKGQTHDGLHPGIVDVEIWERIAQKLACQTQTRRVSQPDDHSFLVGSSMTTAGTGWGPAMRRRVDGAGATMCRVRRCRDAKNRPDRLSAFRRQRSRTRLPTQSGRISQRRQTRSTAVTSTRGGGRGDYAIMQHEFARCEGADRARTMCETRSTAPRSAPRGSRLF